MSFYHAAALALVGWYLMIPIPSNSKAEPFFNLQPDLDLPLSRWTISKGFDNADDCQDTLWSWQLASVSPNGDLQVPLPELQAKPKARLPKKQDNQLQRGWDSIFRHAQCIVTDDPRLKDK